MSIVLSEAGGPVRHIVLNRPEKRNALSRELIGALRDAFAQAAADRDVACVVVRGAGPMFSAGIDVAELGTLAADPGDLHVLRSGILDAWNLLEQMPKPTIPQVHGACLGAAMELALACDLRTMAADAVMGLPETRIGLIPDVGGSTRRPSRGWRRRSSSRSPRRRCARGPRTSPRRPARSPRRARQRSAGAEQAAPVRADADRRPGVRHRLADEARAGPLHDVDHPWRRQDLVRKRAADVRPQQIALGDEV